MADAHGSGPCGDSSMGVRVPPPAPEKIFSLSLNQAGKTLKKDDQLKKSKRKSLIFFIVIATGLFLLFTLPFPCLSQEAPFDQIEVANKALEEGRFEDAIKTYSSLLEKNPDNFALKARLARAYYLAANENPDYFYQAAREYKEIIQKVPDFSLPYIELGQIAYLLGLNLDIEGKEKYARQLYESALDWFDKYIKLEKKGKAFENQKEVATTRVLQAIVYNRMGEKDMAFQFITQAKEEYKFISSQQTPVPSLYDYFARSGVEYMNAKLYNQALIYLEGAWLIDPRPQVKSLFESVVKAKGVSISLPEPVQKKEEKITPEEALSSLEEKLDTLEEKVTELTKLKDEVEKLKAKFEHLPRIEGEKLDQQMVKLEEYFNLISQLEEKINSLSSQIEAVSGFEEKIKDLQTQIKDISGIIEEVKKQQETIGKLSRLSQQMEDLRKKVDELNEKVKDIKSVADMFGILKIQIQELRKTVEDLARKIDRLEKTQPQEGTVE